MSESGKTIDEILTYLNNIVKPNLGTIGLSLSPCVVPGRQCQIWKKYIKRSDEIRNVVNILGLLGRADPSFVLSGEEMELGLGAHGEAGVKRVPVDTAKGSVKTMLTHMTNPASATHLPLKKGDQVAVLLNNLGSISNLYS